MSDTVKTQDKQNNHKSTPLGTATDRFIENISKYVPRTTFITLGLVSAGITATLLAPLVAKLAASGIAISLATKASSLIGMAASTTLYYLQNAFDLMQIAGLICLSMANLSASAGSAATMVTGGIATVFTAALATFTSCAVLTYGRDAIVKSAHIMSNLFTKPDNKTPEQQTNDIKKDVISSTPDELPQDGLAQYDLGEDELESTQSSAPPTPTKLNHRPG